MFAYQFVSSVVSNILISCVVSDIFAASTREVILGTDNGQLHEIVVDEKDKKEKHINLLYELKELPEEFTSLQVLMYHLTTSGPFLFFLSFGCIPICHSVLPLY